MSTRIRYTTEHMDNLIRASMKHRANVHKQGLIDPVGNYAPPQPTEAKPEPVSHSGWCLKCKSKKTVPTDGVVPHPTSTAMRAHGKCPDCGTGVHTFMKASDGAALSESLKKQAAL